MGGMRDEDQSLSLAGIKGGLLFCLGLISVIAMISAEPDSAVIAETIWLGGGAVMGAGVGMPFKGLLLGAFIGALLMGALQLGLMFAFRHGT
jgi:hypothetical protein